MRLVDATVTEPAIVARTGRSGVTLSGTVPAAHRTWDLVAGREPDPAADPPEVVVNTSMAEDTGLGPGDEVRLALASGAVTVDGGRTFRVSGVADFVFVVPGWWTAATSLDALDALDAPSRAGDADFLLVASAPGVDPAATVAAIRARWPGVHAFSNEDFVARLEAADFAYFRQISFVLGSITLGFAFLLVTTILTVSVNQRLGEVAALRALGFPRARVAADLVWESVWIVAAGGTLALPLGGLLAVWLDGILKRMPVIDRVQFFVLEPRAVALHVALLAAAALAATVYPVWLAARLPIAATLRRETAS
jgi:putative ABC transport system permease protein